MAGGLYLSTPLNGILHKTHQKTKLSFAFAFPPFYIRAAILMTYEEAQRIVSIATQPTSRLFVEWAKLRQDPDGTCSVVIEPVFHEQQIHSDVGQAGLALSRLLAEASKASDLYFTLSEDGTVARCDREEYLKNAPNRERTLIKIQCSPEIRASITFLGHVGAINAMDGELRLWNAGFCKTAINEHFGGTAFRTSERAKAYVDRFIALGCPEPGSLLWGQLMAQFQGG